MTDENVIVKAVYTNKVNEFSYSELVCTMSNGEEKIFHFHINNPMPREYVIEGVTWECLRGIGIGMWRMAIGEVKSYEANKGTHSICKVRDKTTSTAITVNRNANIN